MKCRWTVESGAYVLGALAPGERSAYERHLAAGCAPCREEVAELAGLPGLLGRLDAATAAAIATVGYAESTGGSAEVSDPVRRPPRAPISLVPAVLATVTAERTRLRRRHRWQLAASGLVAASLAVLVGLGAGLADSGTAAGPPAVAVAPMQAAVPGVPLAAVVGIEASGNGSQISMRCVYEAGSAYHDGAYFDLYVLSRSGLIEQVKHWWAGPGDVDSFTVASRVAPSQIDALQVRAPNGTTLLVYQP